MTAQAGPPRDSFRRAFLRGIVRRCPACGKGHVLRGYVKPVAECAGCGLVLRNYPAEDGPAYFTILISGVVIVPAMLLTETIFHPGMRVFEVIIVPLALLLTLGLLPVVKGAFIAILWYLDPGRAR